MSGQAVRLMSIEEFLAQEWPEDRREPELRDGLVVWRDMVTDEHSWATFVVLGELYLVVRSFGGRGQGEPDAVELGGQVVKPDAMYLRPEHLGRRGPYSIEGPPDLVVEVLSPSTRRDDLGRKLRLYAEHGVEEYLVVDPLIETIRVFRFAEDRDEPVTVLRRGDELVSTAAPGLRFPVDRLFDRPS